MKRIWVIALLILANVAYAAPRSYAAKSQFMHEHPCPLTDLPRGPCPGYVIDHVIPLCAGGPDRPTNMQWQTAAEAKVKDREERRQCRAIKQL